MVIFHSYVKLPEGKYKKTKTHSNPNEIIPISFYVSITIPIHTWKTKNKPANYYLIMIYYKQSMNGDD